ncbi:MAG TPA: FGGY family carbohydrate kinase, partial [Tepidisphaeraceae bacterium]
MPAKNFLAFDLGAESGRAVLGTLDGNRLSLAEKHRFLNPTGRMLGYLHWNVLAQWEELKTGLRKSAGTTLDGIGVDTWGVDFGLLDRDGQLIGQPFHYRDTRTDGVMERTFARLPREQIFQATGLQFMQLNTLFQLLAMVESSSAALEHADSMLFMPD